MSITMKKLDINIEFAHVSFNKHYDKKQVYLSAEIAKRLLEKFNEQNLVCSTSILIDDKHTNEKLNVEDVTPFIDYASQNIDIDYICYESHLTNYKKEMFKCILENRVEKIQEKILSYEESHGKIACSHDIAIWHLMRLGYIRAVASTIVPVGACSERQIPPFPAEKVISILVKSDKKPEEQAEKEILRYCKEVDIIDRIKRIYYDSISGDIIDSEKLL